MIRRSWAAAVLSAALFAGPVVPSFADTPATKAPDVQKIEFGPRLTAEAVKMLLS